ncbi:von Willebrand factor D and EGF domain-containing protein-like [Bactrocera tryoni]|uniref:von Willebrand factor D and EGF domain-containing protein-like n=1 Tax=Bactrocera tryoni TaxID=59916 RepID=UPI001A972133|nr:von Willebrand factor D and EGF domain-containing protein-like [Bactrocera tryoni]
MPRLRLLLFLGLTIAVPLTMDAAVYTCNIQLVDGVVKKVCRKLQCPVSCSNGICNMQLQSCMCNKGYEFIGGSCVPMCEPSCGESQICTAPNVCECAEGYALLNTKCEPFCKTPCDDTQYCAAPNTCACLAGYNNATTGGCEPICMNDCGEHGRCKAPNLCKCDEGYSVQGQSGCAPICDAELCANADCIGPYQCICREGYTLNFDTNKCEPLTESEEDQVTQNILQLIDVRSGLDSEPLNMTNEISVTNK